MQIPPHYRRRGGRSHQPLTGTDTLTTAYINRIATALPPHDLHDLFQEFVCTVLAKDADKLTLFRRMSSRPGIEHPFSFLGSDDLPMNGACRPFYAAGTLATTKTRMQRYEHGAPVLAQEAVACRRPR